ncbi:MAG: hypothetical protein UV36_C0011G0010, partial [Parcubacteria group bacterium GW2011_GWC2_42_6]
RRPHGGEHQKRCRMRFVRYGQMQDGRPARHYSPEAIAYAKQRSQVLLNTPKAEEGWSAVSAIAENFGDSNDRLTKQDDHDPDVSALMDQTP